MVKMNKKEEVINYLMDYMSEHQLQGGDELPTQVELVNTLKISRTTIREAVNDLEGKKIIKVINGRGMFVEIQKEKHLLSGLALEKKKETLIDVLESRWAIETGVLSNIIKHITNEELKHIGTIVEELMAKYNYCEIQNDIDKKFHYALYNSCRNRVLKELIISLGHLTDELWDFPLGIKNPFINTIPLHKKLYEAIVERDFLRAKHYNDAIFIMMIDEIKTFSDME